MHNELVSPAKVITKEDAKNFHLLLNKEKSDLVADKAKITEKLLTSFVSRVALAEGIKIHPDMASFYASSITIYPWVPGYFSAKWDASERKEASYLLFIPDYPTNSLLCYGVAQKSITASPKKGGIAKFLLSVITRTEKGATSSEGKIDIDEGLRRTAAILEQAIKHVLGTKQE